MTTMRIAAMALAATLISGHALGAEKVYTADLSGSAESPPSDSKGAGKARVAIDAEAGKITVSVDFKGLSANSTAAHIHCCTGMGGEGMAGPATMVPSFEGFPKGVTEGSYQHGFDGKSDASFNPGFVKAHGGDAAGALAALAAGLESGKAYLNVHSSAFPAGEIRGFLKPAN